MDDSFMDAFGIDVLDKMRLHYEERKDYQMMERVRSAINRKGSVQTPELENSGKLFKHRNYDPETNRVTHSYTGDPICWMKEYMSPGMTVSLDTTKFTGRNSEAGKAWQERRRRALEAAGL